LTRSRRLACGPLLCSFRLGSLCLFTNTLLTNVSIVRVNLSALAIPTIRTLSFSPSSLLYSQKPFTLLETAYHVAYNFLSPTAYVCHYVSLTCRTITGPTVALVPRTTLTATACFVCD
jgi:hypothetical protein